MERSFCLRSSGTLYALFNFTQKRVVQMVRA